MSHIVLYVGGPLTTGCFDKGIFNLWTWEQNVRRAEALALKIAELGIATICPHTMARFWFGHVAEDVAIEMDNALLKRCDGLALVEGWQYSKGTKGEIALAHAHHMPVFETLDEIVHWAAERVTQPIELPIAFGRCPDGGLHEWDEGKKECRNCGKKRTL